ncbi:hypothetical protein P154DRAFT_271486 [Amniculicola lignicola CBS 123094]|uniref:Uncharacterized protein n=1 Tax=Amniculicola lignicola CBS 123094 TaxID=1392246 RepID=A0A6A5W7M0_9PLEO|nr:hypothetical protein P154DRAFT_271486 [Amniculicola lignicola CBS 123094]
MTSEDLSDHIPARIPHDDLCPICHLLIYNPVTTVCNHTLCHSCMAQWAEIVSLTRLEPSTLDLDLSDFDPSYDPLTDLLSLEASCPMCRTPTTARLNSQRARELEARYTQHYAERKEQEEQLRGEISGEASGRETEGVMLLIGNRHRVVMSRGESEDGSRNNKHDWTFFVRCSRVDIVEEVRIYLHPTFQPARLILPAPPFEVRRLGWGYFNVKAEVVLRKPYSWVTDESRAWANKSG